MKLINKLITEKSELVNKILDKFQENKNQDIALIYNTKLDKLDLYDVIEHGLTSKSEQPLVINDFIIVGIFRTDKDNISDKLNKIIEKLEQLL